MSLSGDTTSSSGDSTEILGGPSPAPWQHLGKPSAAFRRPSAAPH